LQLKWQANARESRSCAPSIAVAEHPEAYRKNSRRDTGQPVRLREYDMA